MAPSAKMASRNNFKLGLCAIASRLILDKCADMIQPRFTDMLLQLQPLAVECAMYMRGLAALAAASLIGGCAIHPQPEDVTVSALPISSKQIRCETRDAARELIRRQLERLVTYGNIPSPRTFWLNIRRIRSG